MIDKKIGFFDSGIGGLSVLKCAKELMPEENYIYYGDSANAPYGSKTKEQIKDLTYKGVKYLLSNDIKALVIACNTATSATVDDLRRELDIPVVSMEPAVKPAVEAVSGKILVMATPATIALTRYHNLLDKCQAQDRIINLPLPELAGLIEDGIMTNAPIEDYLREQLSTYVNGEVDAVVLGCTHYVLIKDKIKALFPESVKFFDGNKGTVMQLMHVLESRGIKKPKGKQGTIILNSSSDDQYTLKMYTKLLY